MSELDLPAIRRAAAAVLERTLADFARIMLPAMADEIERLQAELERAQAEAIRLRAEAASRE